MSCSSSSCNNTSVTTTNNNSPKWSELPKELQETIPKHLTSRIDVFRFRAVSTSWRSIVSPSHLHSQPIPLTLPPPISATAVMTHFTICRLQDPTPTTACLLKVVESDSEQANSNTNLKLVHPLLSPPIVIPQTTNTRFRAWDQYYPNINVVDDSGSNVMRCIDMMDLRLVELIRGFSLKFETYSYNSVVKKAVSFRNEGIIFLFDSGILWYWVFGAEDWVHLGNDGAHYDDVMVYQNKYYAIDNLGVIYWIDVDRSFSFVEYSTPLCGFGHLKSLVVSEGEFYVVDSYLEHDDVAHGGGDGGGAFNNINNRRQFRRVGIKVYKLDEEWGAWVDVKSLGDRVFVLGQELSYAVDVKDFPGCAGDCIYFVDPRMEDRNVTDEVKRLVVRVFRFDNGSIRTMDCFPAYKRLFTPPRNWFVPTPSQP